MQAFLMTKQASSWKLVVLLGLMARAAPPDANLPFTMRDDRFMKDGKNFQIISGRLTLYTSCSLPPAHATSCATA